MSMEALAIEAEHYVVEVVEEHYVVEVDDYGRYFVYHAPKVIIRCGTPCENTCVLTPHYTTCGLCGADYCDTVSSEISKDRARKGEWDIHPWKRVHPPAKEATPY